MFHWYWDRSLVHKRFLEGMDPDLTVRLSDSIMGIQGPAPCILGQIQLILKSVSQQTVTRCYVAVNVPFPGEISLGYPTLHEN